MLRPVRSDEILEWRCQSCHTDRAFARLIDTSRPELLATVNRMRSLPGADIPADEVPRIEAALLL